MIAAVHPSRPGLDAGMVGPGPDLLRLVHGQHDDVALSRQRGQGRRSGDGQRLACDDDVGVVVTQPLQHYLDFRLAHVMLGEQDLSIEVGHLHHVRIHQMQFADARLGQSEGGSAADAADTDYRYPRLPQQQLGIPARHAWGSIHPPPEHPAAAITILLPRSQTVGCGLVGVLDISCADQGAEVGANLLSGLDGKPVDQLGDDLVHCARAVEGVPGARRTRPAPRAFG